MQNVQVRHIGFQPASGRITTPSSDAKGQDFQNILFKSLDKAIETVKPKNSPGKAIRHSNQTEDSAEQTAKPGNDTPDAKAALAPVETPVQPQQESTVDHTEGVITVSTPAEITVDTGPMMDAPIGHDQTQDVAMTEEEYKAFLAMKASQETATEPTDGTNETPVTNEPPITNTVAVTATPPETTVADAPEAPQTQPAPAVTQNTAPQQDSQPPVDRPVTEQPVITGVAFTAETPGEPETPVPAGTNEAALPAQAYAAEDTLSTKVSKAVRQLQDLKAKAEPIETQPIAQDKPVITHFVRAVSQENGYSEASEEEKQGGEKEITGIATATPQVRQEYTRPLEFQDRPNGTTPTPVKQIETELIRNLEDQKMEFRMQLQPVELGKVDVRMALEGGKLTVVIISTAKTNELLTKQVESLAATLKLTSPELTSVQVVAQSTESGTSYLDSALNGDGSFAGQQENGESGKAAFTRQPQEVQTEDLAEEAPVLSTQRTLDYNV